MALSDYILDEEQLAGLALEAVDEQTWLTSADWWRLACFLCWRDEARYNRHLRLFCCGCARQGWAEFRPEVRRALTLAEAFCDPFYFHRGEAESELDAAQHAAEEGRLSELPGRIATRLAPRLGFEGVLIAAEYEGEIRAEHAVAALRDVVFNPFRREPDFDEGWLWRDDAAAYRLAREAHFGYRFDLMPRLGDALEAAGCGSEEVLAHCRGGGPHFRGCWVVTRLLALDDTDARHWYR